MTTKEKPLAAEDKKATHKHPADHTHALSEDLVPAYEWAYGFDSATGCFIGPVQAMYSPLDGTYPLPANSVAFAPEGGHPGNGKIHRINADRTAWEIAPDYSTIPLFFKSTGHVMHGNLQPGVALPNHLTTIPPRRWAPEDNARDVWDQTAQNWLKVPDFTRHIGYDKETGKPQGHFPLGVIPSSLVTLVMPPPHRAHFAVRWDESVSAWGEVLDHRGTKYWNEHGDEFVITELGEPVPEGMLTLPPPVGNPFDTRNKRDGLLVEASAKIGALQDHIEDLAANNTDCSQRDVEQLKALKAYRLALHRMDVNAKHPVWPTKPEDM